MEAGGCKGREGGGGSKREGGRRGGGRKETGEVGSKEIW